MESVSTSTCNQSLANNTTIFYPGEIPFKNQGTCTSPISMGTTGNLPQQNTNKGDKKKSSRNNKVDTQP